MFHNPAQRYKDERDRYLEFVGDSFVFDAASGIHTPKAYYKAQKRSGLKKVWKNFRKYWALIILNSITLIFLIRYTNYARLQWTEAKRMADEAHTATGLAQQSLQTSKDQFAEEERPYIWFGNDHGSPSFFTHPDDKEKKFGWIVWDYHY